MSIQIQMVGTGNAFAKKYYNNNALIYAKDFTLLIDCGFTAPASLYQLRKPYNEIDGILITHLHADHIGGLEELAYSTFYIHKKKQNLYVPHTLIEPLWENSLKGGLHNGEADCNLNTYFNVFPLFEEQTLQISPELSIEIIHTEHIPNKKSYSILLNETVFYSADMIYNASLIEHMHFIKKCKYILHECQFKGPAIVHSSLTELLTLPDEIQAKIFLMHYEDSMEEYQGKTGKMNILRQHKVYDLH